MFLYADAGATAQPSMLGGLLPMLFIFVIFYFILIRPQQKKQKAHQARIQELKKNAKVVTAGGIYGTIVRVMDDRFELEISSGVNIFVLKSAVATVVEPENKKEEK